jgi:hypothetical protein
MAADAIRLLKKERVRYVSGEKPLVATPKFILMSILRLFEIDSEWGPVGESKCEPVSSRSIRHHDFDI